MRSIDMLFSDIHPFVRYVQRIRIDPVTYPFKDIRAYDCRFFYVQSGTGTVTWSGEPMHLSRGLVFLFGTGIQYNITSSKDDPLILLGANFDYTHDFSYLKIPIPPTTPSTFDDDKATQIVHFTDLPQLNKPVLLNDCQNVEITLEQMLREYHSQKLFCSTVLTALFTDILVNVGRSLIFSANEAAEAKIDSVLDYIHKHHSEELSNETLGSIFGYHPNYMNRLIRNYTGRALHQYLIHYRLTRAMDLLLSTDLPVGEIARRVGFRDICHFNRIFRQHYGNAPSRIRINAKFSDNEYPAKH